MGDYAAKADDYRKQAEKKLKSVLGFFGNKHEDASDLFDKAANHYKLAKCWKESSEMYEKLGECYLKMDSKHEAATAFVDAAKTSAKTDPVRSQALLQRAVSLYTEMGRLNMAARQLKEIAEQNEKGGQKEEAIAFYNQVMTGAGAGGGGQEVACARYRGLSRGGKQHACMQAWHCMCAGDP